MIFFIANLVVSFFIFLFSLYSWAKDDFILLRKNITLEQMFNYAFSGIWIMLLFARIFYVIFHPSLRYINPLIFFIFIYFPGLSLTGGVIGIVLFLFYVSRKKSIPRGRLFDIFSLAFFPGLIVNIFLSQLLDLIFIKKVFPVILGAGIAFLIVAIILAFLFKKDKTKDGIITIFSIMFFSIISLLERFFTTVQKKSLLLDKEVIVLAILFILSVALSIRQRTLRRKR